MGHECRCGNFSRSPRGRHYWAADLAAAGRLRGPDGRPVGRAQAGSFAYLDPALAAGGAPLTGDRAFAAPHAATKAAQNAPTSIASQTRTFAGAAE